MDSPSETESPNAPKPLVSEKAALTVPPEPWWRNKFVISFLGTLAAGIGPAITIINKQREVELSLSQKEKELALAQRKENEKIRVEYLALAIDKKNHDAEERLQYLRFLSVALKDDAIGQWAKQEIGLVESQVQLTLDAKTAEINSKAAKLDRLNDKIAALRRKIDQTPADAPREQRGLLQSQQEELAKQAAPLKERIDKLDLEIAQLKTELSKFSGPEPLDMAAINRVTRLHSSEVQSCYNALLDKNPNVEGQVTIRLVMGPNGRPTKSEVHNSTFSDPTLGECIADAALEWQFPRPAEGVTHHIDIGPFVLKAAK